MPYIDFYVIRVTRIVMVPVFPTNTKPFVVGEYLTSREGSSTSTHDITNIAFIAADRIEEELRMARSVLQTIQVEAVKLKMAVT